MPRVANQKQLLIDKPENPSLYAKYPIEDLMQAVEVLKFVELKVYLYLLSNKAQIEWIVCPSNAENYWGIPSSSWDDGIKGLTEKGFIEDGKIHSKSTKPIDEIRRKKRKSNKHEIRSGIDTKFVENNHEIHSSNNNNNTTMDNSYLNASIEITKMKPEDKAMNSELFVF